MTATFLCSLSFLYIKSGLVDAVAVICVEPFFVPFEVVAAFF